MSLEYVLRGNPLSLKYLGGFPLISPGRPVQRAAVLSPSSRFSSQSSLGPGSSTHSSHRDRDPVKQPIWSQGVKRGFPGQSHQNSFSCCETNTCCLLPSLCTVCFIGCAWRQDTRRGRWKEVRVSDTPAGRSCALQHWVFRTE